MSSYNLVRLAGRAQARCLVRPPTTARRLPRQQLGKTSTWVSNNTFSTSTVKAADSDGHAASDHHEESFEEFTARYEKEFEGVNDVFELQRNLNNAFAYDLVPSPSVIVAALRAARRVNDFPTAVRIFEGIRAKVENKGQYDEYLRELKGLRDELGVSLKEDLYPDPRAKDNSGSTAP